MSKNIARTAVAAVDDPPTPQTRESPSSVALHGVLKLANKLMAPFATYLEHRHKISLNEFRLLMLIGRFPHTASHELVELTGVNPMSVSRAVATLQKHGRISVDRDEANRRRKTLSLTAEGERLYKAMRPQTDSVADYLVSALKPAEITNLNAMLSKLIDTLEARDDAGVSLFLDRTRPPED
ncbi:MarR family winged helix-turn-helix transcriptional regulator [Rhizorhapis suberifaciens]|uniref:DNA-binding MarR family transcriptional regulator n=1 Tax=Rhizorhapis suberifaciens TaxID=13656 RepID=A0A840HU94_9SPHN|nr:MarR family winged helix-turn-helix transcriptional regulator [Rhizorhapis suberifaciens]MBB4641167.1 DNA-binding MarR family transcriptional regulator [Rhizorhapis suberifaciens]